jgi:tetratricopeptide (TPR) repeat protein
MEDYYAVVGVARTATPDEVDKKIREQLRMWQRRTTNADLSRRQEAERRVQLLGEARTTLLDAAQRKRYDEQLGQLPAPGDPPAETTTSGTVDWLERARRCLANNDYRGAAHAARQARNQPNPPVAVWGLLARANAGLGNLDDALYEARQAVSIDDANAQAHLDLAHVCEQRGEWRQAFEEYETASRLDPEAEAPEAGMARSLASSGDPAVAVDHLERRYARALPNQRVAAGRTLGRALVSAADQAARGTGGGYRVSTPSQVGKIGRLLERTRQVTTDPEIMRSVGELERLLVRTEPARPGPAYGAAGGARSSPAAGGPPGYQRPGQPPPGPSRTNGMAIASLVLALLGLLICVSAPVGAVLGHLARAQIRDRGGSGDGLALAGILIGWLLTGLACCGIGYVIINA